MQDLNKFVYKNFSEGLKDSHDFDIDELKFAAFNYWEQGFNVVAIRFERNDDGKVAKKPLVEWHQWQDRRQTLEELKAQPWNIADGLALVCNWPNKDGYYLACIDYDTKKVSEQAKATGKKLLRKLPTTRIEETISAGLHYPYLSKVKPRAVSQFHDTHALELIAGLRLCIMAPSKGYRRLNDNDITVVEDVEGLFYRVLGVPDPREEISKEIPRNKLQKWLEIIKPHLKIAGEGPNYIYCHCPFHGPDRNPSFAINKQKLYAVDYHDGKVYNLKQLAQALGVKLHGGKRRFNPKPLAELVEQAKPIEYICEPLVPKRSVVMLAGKAGVGKSMVALHFAHEIACGGEIFGRFEVSTPSKVLLIDEENNPSVLKQRAELMGLNPLTDIDCLVLEGFRLSEDIDQLESMLSSGNYRVVIVDNWTDTSLVDENKAWEVSGIFSTLRRLAYDYDCTFIIIHHLRKNLPYVVNEIDELRGSSVLVNEPDLVLLLQKDELSGERIVKTIKMRFGEPISFKISFLENEDGHLELKWVEDIDLEQTDSNIMECAKVIKDFLILKGTEARRKEILQAAQGFSTRTVDRTLRLLLSAGIVERVKKGIYKLKRGFANLPNILYNNGKMAKTNPVEQQPSNNHLTTDAEKQASNEQEEQPASNNRICWICGKPILENEEWVFDASTGKPAHTKCLSQAKEGLKGA